MDLMEHTRGGLCGLDVAHITGKERNEPRNKFTLPGLCSGAAVLLQADAKKMPGARVRYEGRGRVGGGAVAQRQW